MDNTSLAAEQVILLLVTLSVLSFFMWVMAKKSIHYFVTKYKRKKIRKYNLAMYIIVGTYKGEIRCIQEKENPNKLIYI